MQVPRVLESRESRSVPPRPDARDRIWPRDPIWPREPIWEVEAALEWWDLPRQIRDWSLGSTVGPTRSRLRTGIGTAALAVAVGAGVGWSQLAGAQSNYTIARGDTLSAISARTGVSIEALAAANGITNPDFIVAGRLLVIPSGSGAPASTDYVVKRGDTLDGIAAKLGVSRAHLQELNALTDSNRLLAGQILSVRGVSAQSSGTYVVRPGDTLDAIARRTGASVSAIAGANGITDPNRIYPGQTLLTRQGWVCPVPGGSFVNDYGYIKPNGSFHNGVDLFAAKGTPVVAPVAGTVSHSPNNLGGLALHLNGADGHRYYFAHLDGFAASGSVAAGQVIGYVGNTGDAHNTADHLHFEIRLDGVTRTNPFPSLVTACR